MTANEAFEIYAALLLVSTRNKQIEVGRWANHIEPILGNHELSSITSLKILLFEKHLIGKKQAPQSIHHCLSLLRRVLNRACEWELYPGPVPKFHMPKFDNRRIRFLSPTEAEAVLLDLKSRSELWHDLALFALSTGLRKGELLALTPSQINLSANLCSVLDSKSGKGRSVPLHPEALKVAQKYLKQPSATLFTANGHRINHNSTHIQSTFTTQ